MDKIHKTVNVTCLLFIVGIFSDKGEKQKVKQNTKSKISNVLEKSSLFNLHTPSQFVFIIDKYIAINLDLNGFLLAVAVKNKMLCISFKKD